MSINALGNNQGGVAGEDSRPVEACDTTTKRIINAAIGLIYNEFGQILCSQRLELSYDYANSLEFPGGKIQPEETPQQALIRELEEELSITVLSCSPKYIKHYQDASRDLTLHVFVVNDYLGVPYGREGQEVEWFNISDLEPSRFPPANEEFINRLKEEYLLNSAS